MVARRPNLPRSLRRSASRPARKGRQPPDRLIAAAEAGLLTRHNVAPGTRGAQAVNAVYYQRRTSPLNRKPGQTVREQAGHETAEVREQRSISVLYDRPQPYEVLEGLTRGEIRRAGRYNALVDQLAAGQLSPQAFRRRVSGWAPLRGERLLSDPDRVLAVLEARRASGLEIFRVTSGQAA